MRISLTQTERRKLRNFFRAGGIRLRVGEDNILVNPELLPEVVELEDGTIFPEDINIVLEILEPLEEDGE